MKYVLSLLCCLSIPLIWEIFPTSHFILISLFFWGGRIYGICCVCWISCGFNITERDALIHWIFSNGPNPYLRHNREITRLWSALWSKGWLRFATQEQDRGSMFKRRAVINKKIYFFSQSKSHHSNTIYPLDWASSCYKNSDFGGVDGIEWMIHCKRLETFSKSELSGSIVIIP